MFLIAQLWLYLLCSCLLGVLIGLTARRFYRAVQIQHTLEAVEFRHTEQLAGVSAEHEAALMALEQLRHEYQRVQEQGGPTHDLQTRIDLREQQLKELGSQLRRVNQELKRNQVNQQQYALERKQAATEIETLRAQVAASRARLAQVVNAHEEEKSALVRQLVALMPSAGRPAGANLASLAPPSTPRDPAAPVAGGPGTFSAAAALAGVSLAPAVAQAGQRPAEPVACAEAGEEPQAVVPAEPAGTQAQAQSQSPADDGSAAAAGSGEPAEPASAPASASASALPAPATDAAAMAEAVPGAVPAQASAAAAGAAVTIDRLLAPVSGSVAGPDRAAFAAEPDLQTAVQAGIAAAMSAMGQPGAGAAPLHH